MSQARARSQTSRLDGSLVLGAIALFTAGFFLFADPGAAPALASAAGFGSLSLLSLRVGSAHGLAASLFCLAAGLFASIPLRGLWPLPIVLALVAYEALLRLPALAGLPSWRLRGRVDARTAGLIALTAVVAALVLVAWALLGDPLTEGVRASRATLREFPQWSWPVVVLAFAALNAAAEEGVFRGVFQQLLTDSAGAWTAIVVQAASFGALHYEGFPGGAVGVALSGAYGLVLGVIRHRSGGLLAPWIAHLLADLVIVSLVALLLVE